MFNEDIVIYNFLKKIAVKIVPAFGMKLLEIPIGSLLFDVTVVLAISFLALSKANKIEEKVKK